MTIHRVSTERKVGSMVLSTQASTSQSMSRDLALGYVRLSRSRKGVENLSPERQEGMIRERAKHESLECHVYRDTTGHKSGRSMKGRQGMDDLLYEVVTNPRVAAVIVAEFSRAHRSVFLSTQMIELLRRHDVRLIFANEMSEPDLNNPTDRFMLAIKAASNEYYANQVAELQLIAVTNRRDKGEWVGRAPFGTVNRRGVLKLSKEGAWVLPDGRFCTGKPDQSPDDGAIYRTYAKSLAYILHLYLSQPNGLGTGRIARTLNAEGYPFRNERGLPCAFTADDVRRALADWPAYGGFYGLGRAKDRPVYKDVDAEAIPLNRKRTLFPLDDLKRVGQMRKRRGFEQPTDDGIIHNAKAYPLAQVVRCAACEAKAAQLGDERYRTRLGGHMPNARRYRHTLDNACICRAKSVLADDLEALFVKEVLTRLTPKRETFQRLLSEAAAADTQPDPEYAAQVEWYADTTGHKSGRYEKNRPDWLALKARIGDPDVIAIIANDLSRLHRKLSRLSDLLDLIDEHHMELILAAPGRELDTSTPMGRTIAQFIALQDEAYSIDISVRAKDTAIYRRKLGKVNGQVPFGTMHDEDGYLVPDVEGAWTLPDGTWVTGTRAEPPDGAADFRSYYRCAMRMLILYAYGSIGYDTVAYHLNEQGWLFSDRKGVPRLITSDDVRRVVANWPEFGGAIVEKTTGKSRSKDRSTRQGTQNVHFNPARAVMPIKLLVKVGNMLKERAYNAPDDGVVRAARDYALNRITYCAHCEKLAAEHNNPKLRTTLSGNQQNDKLRYRHKGGVKCGCTNRSVPLEVYERDFGRLLSLLTIADDKLNLLTELSIQLKHGRSGLAQDADVEKEKQATIDLCRRRIDAAVHLYGDGRISREEYLKRVDSNEREIAHWESRTTDTQKAAMDLALVVNAVNRILRVWEGSDEKAKQEFIRALFTSITYNLDTRRIVDFKLKPWAEQFLVLRANLYATEKGAGEENVITGGENKTAPAVKGMEQAVPLSGVWGAIGFKLCPASRRRIGRPLVFVRTYAA